VATVVLRAQVGVKHLFEIVLPEDVSGSEIRRTLHSPERVSAS
jgi:hypothetical protein